MSECYFTTIRELKEFLDGLSEDQLDAKPSIQDSYFLEISENQYTIEGLDAE